MTAPVTAPATSASPTRARRSPAVIVVSVLAVVVVAVVVLALVAPSGRDDGPPLDPSSTAPGGTRASVELAERLGADVEVTSELPAASVDVALAYEDVLTGDTADAARRWVAAGHTLVVADPRSELAPLAAYDDTDPFADATPIGRGACDVTAPAGVAELGRLEAVGPVARYDVPEGAEACFVGDEGTAVVVVERVGDGLLVSVGTPWVFTNEALARADNAGLFAALAVPEEGTRLAVLVAGDDGEGLQPASDGSLGLPAGVGASLLQLLVAFVVYALYRGRRLGRPVPEDPPVQVAGSELTRAVGGLLEHAGARDHAARSLRRAARRRLAAAHGLPASATAETVAATVASRSRLDRERLDAALLDHPVVDDATLAALGRELDRLVALALGGARAPADPSPSDPSPAGSSEPFPSESSPAGPPPTSDPGGPS